MPRRVSIYYRFSRFLERHLPSGLFPRALIILAAPMVLMQTIMTGLILDRHWDNVTKVLSRSVARDIGLLVQLYDESDKSEQALVRIQTMANQRLRLGLQYQHDTALPAPLPEPFFSPVDIRLKRYLEWDVGRPFWVDTRRSDDLIDIRVEPEPGLVFRMLTAEARAYAANTYGLLLWMLVSSLLLLGIAIAFLRKQISPIVDLARAAQSFGTGREAADFHPRGAAEVRLAGEAFLDMRDRIARQVEQRTAMLAGVSHDLRTILTRFKLELAFLGDGPKVQPLKEDVEEMQRMLEAYMAFVKGDGGEATEVADLGVLVAAAARTVRRKSGKVDISIPEGLSARLKPNAFRRLLANLIGNATRHARTVWVGASIAGHMLIVTVDDDGPGIPADKRAEAFRPFVRLDNARNLDETGTGLGLAIALDIARAHGGDLRLEDSPKGGLRAVVEIPV
ncbi:MAG: two-component sensor histidine kinase [Alphaproteobacteria bacterium]|nr:two-component sensor histidine kinase [Alphaproteobacteria bacterium]